MPVQTEPETIAISALNALEYCPRRFYYQFVQGERLVNEFVLEGTLVHRRVHQEGMRTSAEGEITTTRLYLYSERLRIAGFADVIEERDGLLIPVEYKRGRAWKTGSKWYDAVQLCAQALCLEEQLADREQMTTPSAIPTTPSAIPTTPSAIPTTSVILSEAKDLPAPQPARREQFTGQLVASAPAHIPYGYIFYAGSKQRVQVPFDEALRARTLAAIEQAFQVAIQQTPPAPLSGELAARCPACSLLTLCLPDEVRLLKHLA